MTEEKRGFFKGLLDKFTADTSATGAEEKAVNAEIAEPKEKTGFFDRLKQGLTKTHESIVGRIDSLLLGQKQIDADVLEELEEILITADMGVKTTVELIRILEQRLKRNELKDGNALKAALKQEITNRLVQVESGLDITAAKPFVILVIGVNGVGKTTTIGKLQPSTGLPEKKSCWLQGIHSVQRLPNSWRSGVKGLAPKLCATRRGLIHLQSLLTHARHP